MATKQQEWPMDEMEPNLEPARPDEADLAEKSYMPKLPWKWILVGASILSLLFGSYFYREHKQTEDLREQVLAAYERVEPLTARYRQVEGRILSWVESAANEPASAASQADARLFGGTLERGAGLYLRISHTNAGSEEAIRAAIAQSEPDAIASCLGVNPTQARDFFGKGAPLSTHWVRDVREGATEMRLRVLDEELADFMKKDLGEVTRMTRADWFMLVLERGKNRRVDPVSIFVWDLHSGAKLLQTTTQANGRLIPMRIDVQGAAPAPIHLPNPMMSGSDDCSIAAQVKTLVGDQPMTLGNAATPTGSTAPSAGAPMLPTATVSPTAAPAQVAGRPTEVPATDSTP